MVLFVSNYLETWPTNKAETKLGFLFTHFCLFARYFCRGRSDGSEMSEGLQGSAKSACRLGLFRDNVDARGGRLFCHSHHSDMSFSVFVGLFGFPCLFGNMLIYGNLNLQKWCLLSNNPEQIKLVLILQIIFDIWDSSGENPLIYNVIYESIFIKFTLNKGHNSVTSTLLCS